MSVRVRLTRVGSKKNPIWRVVVTDQRSPRDGRFIETIGHYNPQTEPSTIVLDRERFDHWVARGAQPSGTVKNLVKAHAKAPVAVAEPEPVAVAEAAAADTADDAAPEASVAEESAPSETTDEVPAEEPVAESEAVEDDGSASSEDDSAS